ncbi:hypothetical protein [Parasitella parasitica]|uniref:Tc1-like transposase DDE domain-containing protein n=1 Tax=Parasitella parasitica TaxID=35722 RepID=A0A0B7NE47_9FUNG|nr:hypothetical protein [Parasitella parasitica]
MKNNASKAPELYFTDQEEGIVARRYWKKHGEYLKKSVDEEDEEDILNLEQIRKRLLAGFPEDFPQRNSISINSICNYMNNKLQLTLKRTKPLDVAQEVERTQRLRRKYCENLQAEGVNYMDNCIFVDKAGLNSCMVPGRARSKKDEKAHVLTKTKRAKNMSIIGAISHTRLESLQAVIIDKGKDRFIFGKFVAQLLK